MRSWLAIGSLLLVAGSWRLWTPQSVFPRVPLLSFALSWSESVDHVLTWTCLVLWVATSVVLAMPKLSPTVARSAAFAHALLFALLVLLDQHRLQPWAVHIGICLLIVTVFHGVRMLNWLIAFTASIYIYSALSKFDAQFLHTVGQDFLAGLLQAWPGAYGGLSENAKLLLASLFPVGELACGAGLLWPRLRRAALILAIGMHVTLIAILGPWGLAHSWGVLLWNIVFIGLDVLMFRWLTGQSSLRAPKLDEETPASPKSELRRFHPVQLCVQAICVVAMVVPLGERLGVVDHWLGWALYAPHSSRARIELLSGTAARQRPIVQPFVQSDSTMFTAWDYVAVDRWSLATLGVPIYPQQRFYLAVALALTGPDEHSLRVTLLGTADRWTGERKSRVLNNATELEQARAAYWFNTQPRW